MHALERRVYDLDLQDALGGHPEPNEDDLPRLDLDSILVTDSTTQNGQVDNCPGVIASLGKAPFDINRG